MTDPITRHPNCNNLDNCFTASTLVWYTDDPNIVPSPHAPQTRSISEIKVGDFVIAYDPKTNHLAPNRVLRVFKSTATRLRLLDIEGVSGDSNALLETTDEHTFWVVDRGWIRARDFAVGDEFVLANGARGTLRATSAKDLADPVNVYDIEVDEYHTYFVIPREADGHAVLVHNMPIRVPEITENPRFYEPHWGLLRRRGDGTLLLVSQA